jgi:hypothetical protein
MAKNPETLVTDDLRKALRDCGCYFMKISDQFSRGIPDSFVAVPRGLVAIEIKVDRQKTVRSTRTYKSLGLSGAQDHRIRMMNRVCEPTAFVFTNVKDMSRPRLWVPTDSSGEGPGFEDYDCVALGWLPVMQALGFEAP